MATLRSRDLHDRADWVERTLPPFVDTYRNESLLEKLDIDVATMATYDRPGEQGAA